MEILRLDQATYAGKAYTFAYTTPGYYDVQADADGFRLCFKEFPTPERRSFEDTLFGEWLEAPLALGAMDGDTLCGFIEGSMETWNNRFRISNILVFEGHRGCGTGGLLMQAMLTEASARGARMAVLETQSCNIPAIRFYRGQGFSFIGLDTCAYTNDDAARHEVRLEMGRRL